MTSITATTARKEIYKLIERVNEDCKPICITNTKGKSAVLIGENDWNSIEETLYIMGTPNMTETLLKARKEKLQDCLPADSLDW